MTEKLWFKLISLLIVGLGIGWLIGLSVSPVVSIVLTSVVGSAAAIAAVLSGIDDRSATAGNESGRSQRTYGVNPLPLAVLIVGVVVGSVIGISARNRHWLGSDLSAEVSKWTRLGFPPETVERLILSSQYPNSRLALSDFEVLSEEVAYWTDLGIPEQVVVQRLFQHVYPDDGATVQSAQTLNSNTGTVLFGISASECTQLIAATSSARSGEDQQLRALMQGSSDIQVRQLSEIVTDADALVQVVEEVLCSE